MDNVQFGHVSLDGNPTAQVAVLAAYLNGSAFPANASQLLRCIPFGAVVGAIEAAAPTSSKAAEIRLLQDWIEANAGLSPHLFAAWFNIGVTLAGVGDQVNAAAAYRNALLLKPDFHAASINLGLSLEAGAQTDAALQAWDAALQPDEARTALLNHRARLLEQLGRLEEAEATLRTSLHTVAIQPDAIQHWVHLRQKMCLWPALVPDLPGCPPAALLRLCGPLGSLALTDDIEVQGEIAASWVARKTHAVPTRLSPPTGYDHQRIRVGYLSSDFCSHAMSFLIAELFERHDRTRFEIYGYCASREDGSAIRQRVIGAFDHYRTIRHLSDEQAARSIRADEIDILIDLNGITAGARLQVLRWRPASIQATYLGFVGPVPVPELDYLLCDDVVIPPADARLYRPQPLAIGPTYQANDSRRAAAPTLSRRDAGLPEDAFILCCFSNHYKITEEVFAGWMAIMRQAGQTVLWLATDNAWSQANLQREAERAGVAPSRLVFADRCAPDIYMARLAVADLYLDTFPYNAGTVASDALRMGLPLLTLRGRAFASRMASRLLLAVGAPQGITDTLPAYVAAATAFATDPAAHAAFKAAIAQGRWSDTIGDIEGFTRAFETTLSGLMAKP